MQATESREGIVTKLERRDTKARKPMLVLVVKLAGSSIEEERVSFFDDPDVKTAVKEGDHVKYTVARKGNYLNGKNLEILPTEAPKPVPAPPPKPAPKSTPAPAKITPGTRPALHALSAAELENLYQEESTGARAEPARLGQISNQVRYARIEQSLAELQGLLREVLALLQKSFLK